MDAKQTLAEINQILKSGDSVRAAKLAEWLASDDPVAGGEDFDVTDGAAFAGKRVLSAVARRMPSNPLVAKGLASV